MTCPLQELKRQRNEIEQFMDTAPMRLSENVTMAEDELEKIEDKIYRLEGPKF